MHMVRIGVVVASVMWAGAVQAAVTGPPIGVAVTVKNEVTASDGDQKRSLKKDDGVRQDEVIEAGADALGELQFNDDSKLALGPGSRVVLDRFVYDPVRPDGSVIVRLVKGTFRFITGIAAKPSYLIKTPTASISVRGTVFDICIRPNGATWVLLIEGSVRICSGTGPCRVLAEPGKVMRVTLDRKVKPAAAWPDLPGKQATALETAFPFVPAAPSFSPPPAISRDDILNGRTGGGDQAVPKRTTRDGHRFRR
jgi:hypothetical protein